jgi:hypothetical protein
LPAGDADKGTRAKATPQAFAIGLVSVQPSAGVERDCLAPSLRLLTLSCLLAAHTKKQEKKVHLRLLQSSYLPFSQAQALAGVVSLPFEAFHFSFLLAAHTKKYSKTRLNRPPMSPPYWAGQTREPDESADFISEIMKCARHFRPFKQENRINRGWFNQVLP